MISWSRLLGKPGGARRRPSGSFTTSGRPFVGIARWPLMAHDESMDTKQFIASLAGSLAWPAAVFGIALLFRKQLMELLSGPLRRLKAGPLELEFERIISTVQAQIEPVSPVGTPKPSADGSALADLEATARTAPLAAVLEAYGCLERQLHDLLQSAGDTGARDGLSAMALARRAAEKGLITPETVNALQGVTVLRNLAAHGRNDDVSVDRALDYLALVDAVGYTLNQGRLRTEERRDD